MLRAEQEKQLKRLTKQIQMETMKTIACLGVGHIGGSLSLAELLAVLYGKQMKYDAKDPHWAGRDWLVCSKGHAGPAVYATLAARGYFPREELLTLNKVGTNLPSHCDMNKTTGIDMTTGSLGQGFSCAVGVAVGSKLSGDGSTIYTIIGDGESQEGQIWEAAMFAAHRGLDNLIAFTDANRMQIDGMVDEVCSLGDLDAKWRAFGWHVQRIDGHDCEAIHEAIAKAKAETGRPSMIILNTVKGKGVSFAIEAGVGCHSMSVTKEQYESAMDELAR